jgi:hypothetical protein
MYSFAAVSSVAEFPSLFLVDLVLVVAVRRAGHGGGQGESEEGWKSGREKRVEDLNSAAAGSSRSRSPLRE